MYKIQHQFKPLIFVPWCAVSGNIAFMADAHAVVETSDGIQCTVKSWSEIHILSVEAADNVAALYKTQIVPFIREWYKRMPQMDSMYFVEIKLEKYEEPVTIEVVPAASDSGDNGKPEEE